VLDDLVVQQELAVTESLTDALRDQSERNPVGTHGVGLKSLPTVGEEVKVWAAQVAKFRERVHPVRRD